MKYPKTFLFPALLVFTLCAFYNSSIFCSADTTTESVETETWTVGNFVDEFKQPTGEQYIVAISEGTFCNSAATDAPLDVSVIVEQGGCVCFKLYEYKDSLVKNNYSHAVEYSVTVLDEAGEKHSFLASEAASTSKVMLLRESWKDFCDLLSENSEVSILLRNRDRPVVSYLFIIDQIDELKEVYESTFGTFPHRNLGTSEDIMVEITGLNLSSTDDGFTLYATTNLPDGFVLKCYLKGNWLYSESEETTVENGEINVNFEKDTRGNRSYELSVRIGRNSEEMRELVGDDYECLKGSLAQQMKSLSGAKCIFNFD